MVTSTRKQPIENLLQLWEELGEALQALRKLDRLPAEDQLRVRRACRHARRVLHSLPKPDSIATGPAEKPESHGVEFADMVSSLSDHLGDQMAELSSEDGQPLEPVEPLEDASRSHTGLHGYTSTIPIPDLIGFLCTVGHAATLVVTASDETFTLVFEGGQLVQAFSSHQPEHVRLGAILVRQGAVKESDLPKLLERFQGEGGRLGTRLEEQSLITSEQLCQALETQVQELFCRLLTVQDAYFFYSEGLPQDLDRRIRMNITHLFLESARRYDETRRQSSSTTAPAPAAPAHAETCPPVADPDLPAETEPPEEEGGGEARVPASDPDPDPEDSSNRSS